MKITYRSLSLFLTFAWLNKSSDFYRRDAWIKFMWHGLSVLAGSLFIIWLIPFNEWMKNPWTQDFARAISCLCVLAYFLCRIFLRYILSWRGFFRNFKFGFFECDRDRRLKPARHKSKGRIPNDDRVLCDICFPVEIAAYEKRTSDERKRLLQCTRIKNIMGNVTETVDLVIEKAKQRAEEISPKTKPFKAPALGTVKTPPSILSVL